MRDSPMNMGIVRVSARRSQHAISALAAQTLNRYLAVTIAEFPHVAWGSLLQRSVFPIAVTLFPRYAAEMLHIRTSGCVSSAFCNRSTFRDTGVVPPVCLRADARWFARRCRFEIRASDGEVASWLPPPVMPATRLDGFDPIW